MNKENNKSFFWWLSVVLFLTGLLFSPVVLTVSFVFLLSWLFFFVKITDIIAAFWKRKLNFAFIVFFCVYLIGYFLSSDRTLFFNDIKNKLPFLILPLALSVHIITTRSRYFNLILIFNILVFLLGTASFINYLFNFKLYNILILEAKPIPIVSGINHIYFSVILAVSVIYNFLLGFTSSVKVSMAINPTLRISKIVSFIFGFCGLVYLHTIAARTGLVAFYFASVVLIIIIAVQKKKYLHLFASIVLLALMGVLSVSFIGALNNRWEKSLEDIQTYKQKGDINYYSISTRIEYWEKSVIIFKNSPVFGVGNSDVKKEINRIFDEEKSLLNEKNRLNSHNQYLNILAGTGLVGFVIFSVLLILLFRETLRSKDMFKLSFLLICCVSFMFESMLERQIGIAFFAFFSLLPVNMFEESFNQKDN